MSEISAQRYRLRWKVLFTGAENNDAFAVVGNKTKDALGRKGDPMRQNSCELSLPPSEVIPLYVPVFKSLSCLSHCFHLSPHFYSIRPFDQYVTVKFLSSRIICVK